MRKSITLSILSLLLLSVAQCAAQQQDAGLWLSVTGEKRINPALTLRLSEELRMHENMLRVGSFFSDAGIEYDFHPNWRIAGYYRFISKQRLNSSWSLRHRYYADVRYRQRMGKLDLLGRLRFQQQCGDVFSSGEGLVPENYLRPEITLRWRISTQFRPYLSIEGFCPIAGMDRLITDKIRVTTGLNYELNKLHRLQLFYMIQREYNARNPETEVIIGIGYTGSIRGIELW